MFRSILPLVIALLVASLGLVAGSSAGEGGALPDISGTNPPVMLQGTGGNTTGGLRDYPELPGWPTVMGVHVNYSPVGGPATVDVDGDGRMEVFAGSTDAKLYGWRIDATPLPGFPITLSGLVMCSPAIGDIDGDHQPEVLVVTQYGDVYAFNMDASIVPGWPLHLGDNDAIISIVLQDFDGDGILEIILPNGNDLYVFRGNGTVYPGFPAYYQSRYGPASTPAVGDIDGDGQLEIVVEGWEWLSVFHQDGTMAAGWPYHLPQTYDGFSYASPALVDFDGDGKKEIAAGYHESGGGNWAGKVCVWRYDGTVAPGWPYVMQDSGSWTYSTPGVGDIDEDGQLEFTMDSHDGRIYAFNYDATLVRGFPVYTGYVNLESAPGVADIDNDGHMEIVFGSNNSPGAYFSYEYDGRVTPGFPTPMTGAMLVSGSCISDPDGDGNVNICAHDRTGRVHMWNLPYAFHSDRVQWGRPYHDDHHTGNMSWTNPAAVDLGPAGMPLRLDPAWPNPSSGVVSFLLRSDAASVVRLAVVDASGRSVAVIGDRRLGAGESRFRFDPSGAALPAGTYFVRAQARGGTITRPFTLIR